VREYGYCSAARFPLVHVWRPGYFEDAPFWEGAGPHSATVGRLHKALVAGLPNGRLQKP